MGYLIIGFSIFLIIWGLSGIFLKNPMIRIKSKSSFFMKEDEDRFDERKQNLFVSIFLIIIGILLLLTYISEGNDLVSTVLMNIIILVALCFLICIRIFTRKKTAAGNLPPLTKSDKLYLLLSTIFSILVLVFINTVNLIGSVDSGISGNNIYINSRKIPIESVEKLEFKNDFDVGVRISGMSNMKVDTGKYENSELGVYRADLNKLPEKSAIIIKSENKITVFNSKTDKDTEALYKDIKERLDEIKK